MEKELESNGKIVKRTIDNLVFSENNFSYIKINENLPPKIRYSRKTDAFIGEYLEKLKEKHLILCVLDLSSEISKVYVRYGLIHPDYLQMN